MSVRSNLRFVSLLNAVVLLVAGMPLDVTFTGMKCHANSSTLPLDFGCARPSACCCNSTCASWATGRLALQATAPLDTASNKKAIWCNFDGPGSAINASNGSLVWQPSHGGCWEVGGQRLLDPLPFLTSAQATAALHQTRVVVAGDSLLRQLFMRLVAHLRGFPDVVEHYFHADALYASNGTHDTFHVACGNVDANRHLFDNRTGGGPDIAQLPHRGCQLPPHVALGMLPELERPSIIIRFVWDPFFNGLRTDDIAAALGLERSAHAGDEPDNLACVRRQRLLVAGMNYWTADNRGLEARANTSLGHFVGPSSDGKCGSHMLWYPVPGPNQWLSEAQVSERNSIFRDFIQAANTAAQQRGAMARAAVLPCDAMAADTGFARARLGDNVHWQCSFGSLWGSMPSANIKRPAQEAIGCGDHFNLNLVHMMLMHVQALRGTGFNMTVSGFK